MELHPDWKEFIESFLRNEVEFVVIGAFAMAHHGLPRLTGDIDFFRPAFPRQRKTGGPRPK